MGQPYFESIADKRIREAMERGEFDDLKGAGKPLASLDRPYHPDWWLDAMVRREGLDMSGALHPSLALRAEAQRMPQEVADLHSEDAVRRVVGAFNDRVRRDRLRPAVGPTMPILAPTLDVETLVEHWRSAQAERQAQRDQVRAARADAQRARVEAMARARRWWERARGRG